MSKIVKVFFSQPMNGRSIEEIHEERIKMEQEFREFLNELGFEDYILQDVNDHYDEPADLRLPYVPGRIWYLGRSIQTIDRADYVCFNKNWRDADGCYVEMSVARRYFKHEINLRPRTAVRDNDFDKLLGIIFWGNTSNDS